MGEPSETFKAHYRTGYGRYDRAAPDFARCAENVRASGSWPSYNQCTRKNGHGPEGAWCKMHDPVARKAKQAARDAKWRSDFDREKALNEAKAAIEPALRQIAEGHNDPRSLATQVIAALDAARTTGGRDD